VGQYELKDLGLLEPRVPLGEGEIEGVLASHSPEDLVTVSRAEFL
jgi:hypothetical protein